MATVNCREIAAENYYGPQERTLDENHSTHRWRGEISTRYVDGYEMQAYCANDCGAVVTTRVQSAGEASMGNAAAHQPCPNPFVRD